MERYLRVYPEYASELAGISRELSRFSIVEKVGRLVAEAEANELDSVAALLRLIRTELKALETTKREGASERSRAALEPGERRWTVTGPHCWVEVTAATDLKAIFKVKAMGYGPPLTAMHDPDPSSLKTWRE